MEEIFDVKPFSSPAYGPDSVGTPVLVRLKSHASENSKKWEHSQVALKTGILKNLLSVRNFKIFNDDIFLLGYPRSGTTRMSEMIWLMANNFDVERAWREVTDIRFPFFE